MNKQNDPLLYFFAIFGAIFLALSLNCGHVTFDFDGPHNIPNINHPTNNIIDFDFDKLTNHIYLA